MLAMIRQIWTLCMAASHPTHLEKYHTLRKCQGELLQAF